MKKSAIRTRLNSVIRYLRFWSVFTIAVFSPTLFFFSSTSSPPLCIPALPSRNKIVDCCVLVAKDTSADCSYRINRNVFQVRHFRLLLQQFEVTDDIFNLNISSFPSPPPPASLYSISSFISSPRPRFQTAQPFCNQILTLQLQDVV